MTNRPCKRRQRDLTGSLLSEDIVTVGAGVGEIQRAIRAEGDTHTEGEIYQIYRQTEELSGCQSIN